MQKLIAVVTLLSCTIAFADPPADAPLIERPCGTRAPDPDARGCSSILKKGEPAPHDGELTDEQEAVRRSRRDAHWLGELDEAHKYLLMPKPLFITVVVLAVVVSAGIGAGVTYAGIEAGKPKPQP